MSSKVQRSLACEEGWNGRGLSFPRIRIQGQWLESWGFRRDTRVTLELVRPGQFVVTLEEHGHTN